MFVSFETLLIVEILLICWYPTELSAGVVAGKGQNGVRTELIEQRSTEA